MIRVYFVQHAKALSKDIDEKRSLSDVGIEETKKIATQLKEQKIVINKVVHSGKLRAQQTAEIFSDILDVEEISELKIMQPNDEPDELIQQINEDAVMYVGHLPNMERVVSNLVTNAENGSVLKFQNSAVACVEIQGNEKQLKWFITPDVLL